MPRYYFHVKDGENYPDLQGSIFNDLAAAKIEALRFSGDLLSHNAEKFWKGDEWSMRVADAKDDTLFTLRFTADEGTVNISPANDGLD